MPFGGCRPPRSNRFSSDAERLAIVVDGIEEKKQLFSKILHALAFDGDHASGQANGVRNFPIRRSARFVSRPRAHRMTTLAKLSFGGLLCGLAAIFAAIGILSVSAARANRKRALALVRHGVHLAKGEEDTLPAAVRYIRKRSSEMISAAALPQHIPKSSSIRRKCARD